MKVKKILRHHRPRKRRIGIPRGMLRHITLVMLQNKPMSGSEITEEIENYMDWKPSPGSIYPLLSHLQEEELITLQETDDPNLKRFTLTAKGEQEVETHRHHDLEIRNRTRNIRKMYWMLLRGMPEEAHRSYVNLQNQIEETYNQKTDLKRFKEILDNATMELKKISDETDE